MKKLLVVCACCVVCGGIGCAPTIGGSPPAPVNSVDRMDLFARPAALNWDDNPGPDGLEVRVHFYQRTQPLTVTVRGTLELLLFEGKVTAPQILTEKPFHVWSFASEQHRKLLRRDTPGWCYALRLLWGRRIPKGSIVTVVGRYVPRDGRAVYSAPVSIAMNQQ
jgi:hypothetical protein